MVHQADFFGGCKLSGQGQGRSVGMKSDVQGLVNMMLQGLSGKQGCHDDSISCVEKTPRKKAFLFGKGLRRI